MSFEFGMKKPTGFVTSAAEPEEYDVDEEEVEVPVAPRDTADLAAALERDERHRGARPARP